MFRTLGRRPAHRIAILLTSLALAGVGVAANPAAANQDAPARPQGPCDIYAAGGTPCVAAHSTTRALFAAYDGPLYQVQRLSDDTVRDIGVVKPSAKPAPDAGGYADAAAIEARRECRRGGHGRPFRHQYSPRESRSEVVFVRWRLRNFRIRHG